MEREAEQAALPARQHEPPDVQEWLRAEGAVGSYDPDIPILLVDEQPIAPVAGSGHVDGSVEAAGQGLQGEVVWVAGPG